MPENMLIGAVVEDGVITNTLVFDNEDTMREFGCLPLAPYQGIGDTYITPEEYQRQEFMATITAPLQSI